MPLDALEIGGVAYGGMLKGILRSGMTLGSLFLLKNK